MASWADAAKRGQAAGAAREAKAERQAKATEEARRQQRIEAARLARDAKDKKAAAAADFARRREEAERQQEAFRKGEFSRDCLSCDRHFKPRELEHMYCGRCFSELESCGVCDRKSHDLTTESDVRLVQTLGVGTGRTGDVPDFSRCRECLSRRYQPFTCAFCECLCAVETPQAHGFSKKMLGSMLCPRCSSLSSALPNMLDRIEGQSDPCDPWRVDVKYRVSQVQHGGWCSEDEERTERVVEQDVKTFPLVIEHPDTNGEWVPKPKSARWAIYDQPNKPDGWCGCGTWYEISQIRVRRGRDAFFGVPGLTRAFQYVSDDHTIWVRDDTDVPDLVLPATRAPASCAGDPAASDQ